MKKFFYYKLFIIDRLILGLTAIIIGACSGYWAIYTRVETDGYSFILQMICCITLIRAGVYILTACRPASQPKADEKSNPTPTKLS